jgi:hypothetical protein
MLSLLSVENMQGVLPGHRHEYYGENPLSRTEVIGDGESGGCFSFLLECGGLYSRGLGEKISAARYIRQLTEGQ